MAKYMIPPVFVDAVQFRLEDEAALQAQFGDDLNIYHAGVYHPYKQHGEFLFADVVTVGGVGTHQRVEPGDWIVTAPDGKRSLCPNELFLQTFTPATDLDPSVEPEVERVFADFWQSIVAPTGALDVAAVKRELYDYRRTMQEVGKVYMALTGGRISKTNTLAEAVIGEAEALTQAAIAEALAEAQEQTDPRHPWTVALEEEEAQG